MIIVLSRDIRPADKQALTAFLEGKGFRLREIQGEQETILGAVGIVPIDVRQVELLPGVARVIPITSPYKLASREFRKEDTDHPRRPDAGSAGRASWSSPGPARWSAASRSWRCAAHRAGVRRGLLRGGAYKPRTSPYAFQGLGEEGLRFLKEAGEATACRWCRRSSAPSTWTCSASYVDVLQIGARNMQNFELLKRVGALGKPVLLKRGPGGHHPGPADVRRVPAGRTAPTR